MPERCKRLASLTELSKGTEMSFISGFASGAFMRGMMGASLGGIGMNAQSSQSKEQSLMDKVVELAKQGVADPRDCHRYLEMCADLLKGSSDPQLRKLGETAAFHNRRAGTADTINELNNVMNMTGAFGGGAGTQHPTELANLGF